MKSTNEKEADNVVVSLGLLTAHCFDVLTTRSPLESHCLREVFLVLLNLGVILGATIVKVPQIYKIALAGNVAGLSELSFVIEVFAGTLLVGYNYLESYPFIAWGDVLFVVVQCVILVLLFWLYSHTTSQDENGDLKETSRVQIRIWYSATWIAFLALIIAGMLPKWIVPFLGLSPVPCSVMARIPQILQNFRQKHTGQLSFLTLCMMFAGNLARVFTTIAQLDDNILLTSNLIAALTNAVPLLQILYYWSNTKTFKSKPD